MTTLEKILQEIDYHAIEFEAFGLCDDYVSVGWVKEIIKNNLSGNDGWIPVEERLPENAKRINAFCPKYQIMTQYGVTEGWYNPDQSGWYALFWFMTGRFLECEIDFQKGDVPKVIFIPDGENQKVIAWRPMPESYKKDGE